MERCCSAPDEKSLYVEQLSWRIRHVFVSPLVISTNIARIAVVLDFRFFLDRFCTVECDVCRTQVQHDCFLHVCFDAS